MSAAEAGSWFSFPQCGLPEVKIQRTCAGRGGGGRSRFPKALALLRKMTPGWEGALTPLPPKPKTRHPRSVHPSQFHIYTQENGSPGLLGDISNTKQYQWPWEVLSQEGKACPGWKSLPPASRETKFRLHHTSICKSDTQEMRW